MRIFISSPYSNGDTLTDAERLANVNRSIDAAEQIAQRGHVPMPPLWMHFWNERHPHDYDFWMWQCIEWLNVADAVLWLGSSVGSDIEMEHAIATGKAIFFSVGEIPDAGNK